MSVSGGWKVVEASALFCFNGRISHTHTHTTHTHKHTHTNTHTHTHTHTHNSMNVWTDLYEMTRSAAMMLPDTQTVSQTDGYTDRQRDQ